MRDVLPDIERWRAAGDRVAIATVVQTWGSAPRPAGSKMAVSSAGQVSGSVSGGCVENAVVEAAQQALTKGQARLLRFGVTDENAWGVGLACGGTIEVFVEPLDPELYEPLRDALTSQKSAAQATLIASTPELVGRKTLLVEGKPALGALSEEALAAALAALSAGASRRVSVPEGEVFVDVLTPPPRLVVVGGVHIAIPLIALAKTVGFRTILMDPREAFANDARFPDADRILNQWPDRGLAELGLDSNTAVAVLTHDPKLDDPALLIALRSPAFYVGALGSTRTQEKRRVRLREAGLPEDALARLYGPIGLDLGARSPEEIALSVIAQIVGARNPSRRSLKRQSRDE